MSDREKILAAVREALGTKEGAPVPQPPPPVTISLPLQSTELVAHFAQRVVAVGGRVQRLAAITDLIGAVLATLHAANAHSVVLSDAPIVQAMRQPLTENGITCLRSDAELNHLLAADAGITTAQYGIAETGTLLLDAGRERSRLASLLPPLHLCLLPESQLLSTLGEALRALPHPLPYAITFVSGPSRTADIELQLVVGVHGPKDLCVLLIESQKQH
jgi:L-lactate dehydrogenase complex protein LldG